MIVFKHEYVIDMIRDELITICLKRGIDPSTINIHNTIISIAIERGLAKVI